MANYTFYEGANYGLPPVEDLQSTNSPYIGFQLPAGRFGFPSDPRTANQIDAVSKKISTGTKVIEVSGVSLGGQGPMDLMDNIPKQHFTEINRLKKLTGVDLTFHGPLVEATGFSQGNWDEQQRKQAERQILSAVERGHNLDPKGNVVITFHSSNGLPEPETKVKMDDGTVITSNLAVVDERTGRIGMLPKTGKNYFLPNKSVTPADQLIELNEQNWSRELSGITIEAERARRALDQSTILGTTRAREQSVDPDLLLQGYKLAKDPAAYNQFLKNIEKEGGKESAHLTDLFVSGVSSGARYAQEAYLGLQKSFSEAYAAARDPDTIKKLEKLKNDLAPKTEKFKDDPDKLNEFIGEISTGIRTLNSITPPQIFKPLKEFAVDKASDTFANAAVQAYKQFKGSTPIISIENPPAGSGLNRAQDLKDLVDASRRKFADQMTEKGMSEKEAKNTAEKLIGVTWDVGHINMIRKQGFDTKDLLEETKTIAPYVKHIHLSDNFGLEHTELPMGMGNVPIKEQEEIIRKKLGDKFKEVKQIVETGGWFRNFNNMTPFAETLQAFGSPLYSMKMNSYWNQSRGVPGGYFSGYGRMLPEKNFAMYGAGFSALPSELGGQMGGGTGGTNHLSGAPLE